jgi:hypothetical protein
MSILNFSSLFQPCRYSYSTAVTIQTNLLLTRTEIIPEFTRESTILDKSYRACPTAQNQDQHPVEESAGSEGQTKSRKSA